MQAIDLFSGAGGMSIGALMTGIDVKYAVELDKHAAQTFAANHRGVTLLNRDIRSVSGQEFQKLNRKNGLIIFGGPPCQGFSTSNQQNRSIDNEKNWLFREYVRLIKKLKPDWLVFENVKGIVETEQGFFLDSVLKSLEKAGYSCSHFILNSADFGVPQKRNRLFIIGSLHGIELPAPERSVSKPVTVYDALHDLPKLENGASIDTLAYSQKPKTSYAELMRGNLEKCSNNIVSKNANHIIERYEYIPQGGNWQDIPAELMQNYTDSSRCHTGIYRRLKDDEPSVVIGNFRKNMLVHPWQDRGLSVREAARLQSIPDWFRFNGSIGFQQQQVGNLVPPLLAKAVFEQILKKGF